MRLNINTTGHQIDAEEIVVPSSSPYVVRLKHHWVKEETPSSVEVWTDSEKLESQLTEEAYDGNPSSGDKFQVDYKGEQDTEPVYKNAILFHSFQAGNTFYVWYKSQGDVYCAEDINAKADKDSDAVAGNLAEFDANGNPVDSGIDPDTKADKDSDAVAGNLAEFDANGNPVDSGIDPDTKADKDSDAVENNLAKFDSSGNPVDSGIASNTVPIATTATLTFYVNPSTGSDDNDGSSGYPFKTIAKAVSLIPQIVNHNVTINLADGNYSEGITLTGYMGGGEIYILGNGDHPENVVIAGGITAVRCSVGYIVLNGMETTNTGSEGIYLAYCSSYFTIDHVLCDTTDAINDGLYAIGCPVVHILYSTFSNRSSGISAQVGTTVISVANYGANNDVGLYATAATIIKVGPQPGGTTGESAVGGGVIR